MKNVDDIYPLTPMQRVMLLHASGAARDSLFHQFRYELRGPLDVGALQDAWQDVSARHGALRTCFAWEGLEAPVQVVRTAAEVPVQIEDWSDLSQDEADRSLADALRADRELGFDPRRAPLVRVLLVRREDDHFTMVWSSHHLVLDRWCIGVVLDDLTRAYGARAAGGQVAFDAPAGRFRDYVAWWKGRPAGAAEEHWRGALRGAAGATRTLASKSSSGTAPAPTPWSRRLSPDDAQRLSEAARALRVTPGSIAQLALALVMAERAGQGDVVFGTTVSGRPPEVPGVETAVGSFIGNVPTRLRLDPATKVRDALAQVMDGALSRAGHEHLAPSELHEMAGLAPHESLFDALFVWLAEARWSGPDGIAVAQANGHVQSAYPVTIAVGETACGLEFSVVLGDRVEIDGGAAAFGDRLVEQVLALVAQPDAALRDLAPFDDPPAFPETRRAAPVRPALCAAERASRKGREHERLGVVAEFLVSETRALLGDPTIGGDANFFGRGGTSLQAVQLHARIEVALGCEVPLLSLFSEPDLDAMARLICGGKWPLRGGVVRPLRAEGDRAPLICLASPDVNSVGFVNLVRHLSPGLPVLLAQVEPASDTVFRMALSDLPELARRSIEAIEEVVPEGPIRLVGMCDGALIAMEMARQLEARGRTPEFVGVLDSFALGTLSWRFRLRRVGSRWRYYKGRLREELEARLGRGRSRPKTNAPLEPVAVEAPPTAPAPPTDPEEKARTIARLAEINAEWFSQDTPKGLPDRPLFGGTVTLFRIEHQPYWRVRDGAYGWRRHAESVEVVNLGDHARGDGPRGKRQRQETHLGVLREPNVAGTAEAIGEVLDRLDAARGAATSPAPQGSGITPTHDEVATP